MNRYVKDICIFCFKLSSVLPDELYLKIIYRLRVHRKLNLEDPKTFTEKIQKMKLTDHNTLYSVVADKYEVRKYVSDRIGEEYLTKLYGVYRSENEIPFDKLPEKFVFKTTHDSGSYILVQDKSKMDTVKTKKLLCKYLKRNFYWKGREWCYKHITPRIICEELLEDKTTDDLYDYKFFCFHGEPKLMFVATNRRAKTRYDFFDLEFHHLDINIDECNRKLHIQKPQNYEKMLELARILASEFEQVRVDFYNIDGRIIFGELTLYHLSGFERFRPYEWDQKLGGYW